MRPLHRLLVRRTARDPAKETVAAGLGMELEAIGVQAIAKGLFGEGFGARELHRPLRRLMPTLPMRLQHFHCRAEKARPGFRRHKIVIAIFGMAFGMS